VSVLTVLIDTDVLVDFMTDREPFTESAKKIIKKSHESAINAFLAPHSITNIFYILRKYYSVAERKQRLTDLCLSVSVVLVDADLVMNALANNNFDDVEDSLQAECAIAIGADYIVTRNIKDYAKSKIPAVLPNELLRLVS